MALQKQFPTYSLPKLEYIFQVQVPIPKARPSTVPTPLSKMVGHPYADRIRKEEYFEILDETIRTNPYRKSVSAMSSVMAKHGIESNTSNVLGRTSPNQQQGVASFPEKKCALTRALRLALNCNQKLNSIKEDLQKLCSEYGKKNPSPTPSGEGETSQGAVSVNSDKATMTGHLVTLIGEAETIARRIYETAVGLHVTEDYLRQPEDIKLLDFSSSGRIQIPNYNFNHASQLCLEWLHSTALKWLSGFKEEGDETNADFIKIFENFTKAVKDYTEAVCLANQVFRVLLYPNSHGKATLQEYVLSLGHVLKNDVIMEVQALRRAFDNIQYTFERVGWAASIAWMRYSGKNITVETLNENGLQVDHSTFHYKFYEGPPKTKWKKGEVKKTKGGKKVVSSTSKNAGLVDGFVSDSGNLVKPLRKKIVRVPKPVGDTDESQPSTTAVTVKSGGEDGPPKIMRRRQPKEFEEEVTLSRRSRSTPDIVKPKKVKKKIVKVKRVKPTEDNPDGVLSSPSGDNHMFSDQGSRISVIKYPESNEKSYSHSTAEIVPTQKRRTTGPLSLPHALQQKFNAVFGTQVMPMKSVKPKKKKKAAGLVTPQKASVEGQLESVQASSASAGLPNTNV